MQPSQLKVTAISCNERSARICGWRERPISTFLVICREKKKRHWSKEINCWSPGKHEHTRTHGQTHGEKHKQLPSHMSVRWTSVQIHCSNHLSIQINIMHGNESPSTHTSRHTDTTIGLFFFFCTVGMPLVCAVMELYGRKEWLHLTSLQKSDNSTQHILKALRHQTAELEECVWEWWRESTREDDVVVNVRRQVHLLCRRFLCRLSWSHPTRRGESATDRRQWPNGFPVGWFPLFPLPSVRSISPLFFHTATPQPRSFSLPLLISPLVPSILLGLWSASSSRHSPLSSALPSPSFKYFKCHYVFFFFL